MELKEICEQVIEIAKSAGDFIKIESGRFKVEDIEYKGMNDLVSYVDKEAEKLIVEGLSKILPEAGFIAEEGTGEKVENGFNWIIDPLDGTTNFLHGVPHFGVNIALIKDDEILIGVTNAIHQKEMFHAIKGKGAYCNGERIYASNSKSLSEGLVSTGFPYKEIDKIPQYFKTLGEVLKNAHGLRRMGSAAIDLAYVASGRFEAFFEFGLKPWDVAPGILLVQEAGGSVSDFQMGKDYIFGNQILAASKKVHPELFKIIDSNFF